MQVVIAKLPGLLNIDPAKQTLALYRSLKPSFPRLRAQPVDGGRQPVIIVSGPILNVKTCFSIAKAQHQGISSSVRSSSTRLNSFVYALS